MRRRRSRRRMRRCLPRTLHRPERDPTRRVQYNPPSSCALRPSSLAVVQLTIAGPASKRHETAGDWICEACANAAGMDVEIEGHEWGAEGGEGVGAAAAREGLPALEDSDDDEVAPARTRTRGKRKVPEFLESDGGSDSEDGGPRKTTKGE